MAPDPRTEALIGLAYVDRFSVIVEERVYAPPEIADRDGRLLERCVQKTSKVLAKILGLEGWKVNCIGIAAEQRAGLRHVWLRL